MASESNVPRRSALSLAPRFFSREGAQREWLAWREALPFPHALLWGALNTGVLAVLAHSTTGAGIRSSTESACALVLIFAGAGSLPSAWLWWRAPGFLNDGRRRIIALCLSVFPVLALTTLLLAHNRLAAVFAAASALLVSQFAARPGNAEDNTPAETDAADCESESESDPPAALDFELETAGQWLRRAFDEEGADTLEGMLQTRFEPGQKLAMLHVPFCPPFASIPRFSCETADDGVRAKVAAVYSYGARIELKRTADLSEDLETNVRVSAACARAAGSKGAAA